MTSLKKWFGFQQAASRKDPQPDKRVSSQSSEDAAVPRMFVADNDGKERLTKAANELDESVLNSVDSSNTQQTEHFETFSEKNSATAFDDPLHDSPFGSASSYGMPDIVDFDLPFGSGATKVYGYENFGNTCYCNSVLQCLYNLDEFRTEILKYPARSNCAARKRKSCVIGSKPRVFTEASFTPQPQFQSQSNGKHGGSTCNLNNNVSFGNSETSSSAETSRRGSLKFFRTHSENHGSGTAQSCVKIKSAPGTSPLLSGSNGSVSSSQMKGQGKQLRPVHTVVMPSDPISEKLHENINRIIVGRTQGTVFHPSNSDLQGRSNSLPASTSSGPQHENTTEKPGEGTCHRPSIEQRKKAALVKGPVINIDSNLADYLPTDKPTLYSGLKDIFECIVENDSALGVVSPSKFVQTLKTENILFSSSMHQDAHEFLNYLLNELSESLKHDMGQESLDYGKPTFVEKLFQGTLFNSTKCFTCDSVTTRDEPFLDFPIEIQGDEEINIQDILRNYKHRELLTGANKFYCDQCCGLQEAERTVGLKTLPKTLAIHLKRFKYSEERNCNAKLFNRIHYPLTLEVCSYFDNSVCKKYELNGVVIHMGGGPHHGHYVAICKHDLFGWLLFDDETVESINEETVLKFIGDPQELTTAYVLIYKEASNVVHETTFHERNVETLLKQDEHYRRTSSVATSESTLENVPEELLEEESKSHKSKSKLFSFKRSTKA